jgi:hypothetical protein
LSQKRAGQTQRGGTACEGVEEVTSLPVHLQ